MIKKVWLLTTGDGSDGDEWRVLSIHANKKSAELAKKKYEDEPHIRPDGSVYYFTDANEIEEWPLEY